MERRISTDAYWQKAFDSQPEELIQFEGENLERSTFMDFMLKSHFTSEGSMRAQAIFAKWHQVKGVQALDAIVGCINSGGWLTLSEKERELFITTFNRIPEHTLKVDPIQLQEGKTFDFNLQHLAGESNRIIDSELQDIGFEDMRILQKQAIDRFNNRRQLRDELL